MIINAAGGGTYQTPVITSAPAASSNPVTAGQAVTFTAAATDANGNLLSYIWNFGDGASGSGAGAAHTYAAAGIYTVTVTVTNGVDSATSTMPVVVNAAGGGTYQTPVITSAPTASPDPVMSGQAVTFTAAATDPNGNLLSYSWNFGDGASGSGASTAHTYRRRAYTR